MQLILVNWIHWLHLSCIFMSSSLCFCLIINWYGETWAFDSQHYLLYKETVALTGVEFSSLPSVVQGERDGQVWWESRAEQETAVSRRSGPVINVIDNVLGKWVNTPSLPSFVLHRVDDKGSARWEFNRPAGRKEGKKGKGERDSKEWTMTDFGRERESVGVVCFANKAGWQKWKFFRRGIIKSAQGTAVLISHVKG